MPMQKLSTALIGLDDKALKLLETAASLDTFEIRAVADLNTQKSQKIASQFGCVSYDDYRQLIIQNNFECLFVSEAIHNCHQHLNLAIQKKINILKFAPPARNFAEASVLAKAAAENNIIFSVAAPWRFCPDYLKLFGAIQKKTPKPLLVTASCNYSHCNLPVWCNDPVLAGGGVLLMDCYGLVDQLVKMFGLPEQVYSINTNSAADRQQKLALTEDIAAVTMRFADNFCVNLTASRAFGGDNSAQTLGLYYKDKIVQKKKFSLEADSYMADVLAGFANSCFDRQNNKPFSTLQEHLQNIAVIEAAYLSTRTMMPEQPCRIFELTR
ncbi:MAG: Gfo/Idh/MocA family oxidoreductase [Phycisphaerae bacterium]